MREPYLLQPLFQKPTSSTPRQRGDWPNTLGKIVLQQPVDKTVAATDLAQQETVGGVIEKTHIAPGHLASSPEKEAYRKVFGKSTSTKWIREGQPEDQSTKQPNDSPNV